MAIPLPRVVSDIGPGGALTTNLQGSNALAMSNAEAKYAPYTAYANALSHQAYANYLPWQIKAQVLSNPYLALALKDKPELLDKMLNEFGEGMSNPNVLNGGVTIPPPGGRGDSMLGALFNKLIHGNVMGPQAGGGNPLAAPPSGGGSNTLMQSPGAAPQGGGGNYPLVPSTQGGAQGAIGAQTAPFVKSPYISTPTIPNAQGGVVQAPNAETVAAGQKAVLAAKRVDPILNNIQRDWKDFYTIPGFFKLVGSGAANILGMDQDTARKFFVNKGDYSKFLKAQNNIDKSVIDVMKVYDIHQEAGMNERIANIIQPHVGEDKEGYLDRVKSEMNDLRTQQTINEQAITSGFNVGSPEQVAPAPAVAQPGATAQPGAQGGGERQISPDMVKAIQDTATKYNMSVPDVIKYLESKNVNIYGQA